MKKIIITSLLILLAFVSCAQNDIDRKRVSDSLLVVNARWQVDSMDGFVLKRMHFKKKECLGSNQNICVIEVPADSPRKLAFTYEPQRTPTTVHASRNGALAAINGSFFDMGKHNPICYLRIDGVELGVNTPQASDSVHRKYYQYGTVILRNGRPYFVVPDSARLAERSWSDSNIMTAGPMLIRNGKLLPMRDDKTFVTYRHNRTAIGVRRDGTVLLVTLDGRMKQRVEQHGAVLRVERVAVFFAMRHERRRRQTVEEEHVRTETAEHERLVDRFCGLTERVLHGTAECKMRTEIRHRNIIP